MTLGALYDFVQGDTLSKIKVAFVDDEGQPIDFSFGGSAFVRWHIIRDGDGAISVSFQRALVGTDPVHGAGEYQFQPGELYPGTLVMEASATLSTGEVISTKRTTEFRIRARL